MTFADLVNKFLHRNDRHLLHEILYNQHFIIEKQAEIMAKIADVNASLDALDAAVAAIPQGGAPTGITEADLDPVKARIDGAVTALQGKVAPVTA